MRRTVVVGVLLAVSIVPLVARAQTGWVDPAQGAQPAGPPPQQFMAPPPVVSEEAPRYRASITLDPLGILLTTLILNMPGAAVGADIALADNVSLWLEPGYYVSNNLFYFSNFSGTLLQMWVGANFWPTGNALKGFFVGPRLGVNFVSISYNPDPTASGSGALFIGMAQAGYQFVWGGFTLSLGGGVGYAFGSVTATGAASYSYPVGITYNLSLRLGATF